MNTKYGRNAGKTLEMWMYRRSQRETLPTFSCTEGTQGKTYTCSCANGTQSKTCTDGTHGTHRDSTTDGTRSKTVPPERTANPTTLIVPMECAEKCAPTKRTGNYYRLYQHRRVAQQQLLGIWGKSHSYERTRRGNGPLAAQEPATASNDCSHSNPHIEQVTVYLDII